MNCYITIYNLHTWPSRMIPEVKRLGMTPILIDNRSTYGPCKEWLDSCGEKVVRSKVNHGPRAFWSMGLFNEEADRFVVTDCDLDLSGIPNDLCERLSLALDEHDDYCAAGVSLEIEDIPDSYPLKENVMVAEERFWKNKEGEIYHAQIDTTLAMYDKTRGHEQYRAIRLDRPYTARHLPWYEDPDSPDEEMIAYYKGCTNYAFWSNAHKQRVKNGTKN